MGYTDIKPINSFELKWELDLSPPTMAWGLLCGIAPGPIFPSLISALLAAVILLHA